MMEKKPLLIVIDGPMGAGKSTVSKLLQKKLHQKRGPNALISLDRLKRIVSGYKMDSKFHLGLSSDIGIVMSKEYLKKGLDVIVEKAFTLNEYVVAFINPLKRKAKVLVYQLEAPGNILKKRVKERPLHPETKKRPPKRKIRRNIRHFNEFRYQKAKVFDSSKLTPTKIANRILNDIKNLK